MCSCIYVYIYTCICSSWLVCLPGGVHHEVTRRQSKMLQVQERQYSAHIWIHIYIIIFMSKYSYPATLGLGRTGDPLYEFDESILYQCSMTFINFVSMLYQYYQFRINFVPILYQIYQFRINFVSMLYQICQS